MESLDLHYHLHKFEKNPEWCIDFDRSHYRIKDNTITLDEFESRKHEQQFLGVPFMERFSLCDGINTRLGADGWIYTNTGKVVSTYDTKYYYKTKQCPNIPTIDLLIECIFDFNINCKFKE